MLFMGQEFAASSPFLYFADHEPELAKLVCQGRCEFMSQFPSLAGYSDTTELPDPADPATFETCKIDSRERETNAHVVDLHRDLLRLREHDAIFSRQDKTAIEGAVIGPEAFVLRWFDDADDDRLAIFNLGAEIESYPLAEPLQAPPLDRKWELLWSSEDARYGGMGTRPFNAIVCACRDACAIVFPVRPDE